ncbi:MAG: ATP-binding protein [Pseudomonadota bacterium]|nr:ATP-binding protein [Pseudomonadota bacterium]
MILSDVIEFLFVICLFANAFLFLPQAYKIYQAKTAKSVSITTFSCILFVQMIFMLHGFVIDDLLLAYSMALSMLGCLSVVALALSKNQSSNSLDELTACEILDQLPCNVYWKSKDGTYSGVNQANLKAFQLKKEETIGRNLHDILPKEYADKVMIFDHDVMLRKKTVAAREYGPQREDGKQTVYLSRKAPLIGADGEVIGLLGVSFDYTDISCEFQEKAETLQNIISCLPGHISWLDTSNKYLGCNNNMAHSLGLTERSDIVGQDVSILPKMVNPDQIERSNKKVLQEKIKMVVEEKSVREDGSLVTMLSHKVPLFDKNNTLQGLASLNIDISNYKEITQNLEKDLATADIANRVKYTFIENMSHDIRSPLAGIISMTEALVEKSQQTDPEIKDTGLKVLQAGNKLLELLTEIVSISKLDPSNLDIMQKRLSVKNIITNIIDVSLPSAQIKQIVVNLNYDENTPATLICDPIRVHRIIFNLVANAIKFTNKGSIDISVFMAHETADKVILKFSVQDTGIGIPKDQHDFIFSGKNFNAISGANNLHEFGYGLHVVKQFVNDLNGEIYVNSNVGVGSEFVCHLPFKKLLVPEDIDKKENLSKSHLEINELPEEGQDVLLPDIIEQAESHEYKYKSILCSLAANILIVDDDQLVQTASKLLLSNFGCNITLASDGEEALQKIRNEKFDLVFMDIGLPDISGFRVIENIRSKLDNANKDLPIIVLTSHVDLTTLERIPTSVTDIYNKPLTMKLCENILAKYLLKKLDAN